MTDDKDLIRDDIEAYLAKYQKKELLRFVSVGSVDDGKSTLIGRILYDTGMVFEDQMAAVRAASQTEAPDLALLTDGLKAEREQGITIDVAYRYFATDKRKFIIADTPGHIQYTRNMVTGSSTANIALILVDARQGILEQTGIDRFVERLPRGLDTQLGEGGQQLSTGEKQLLSFARALCRNPAVLVLDEATAFIDSETETILEEAVQQSFSDKTSIIIAHRLSTIRRADRIVVVDDGGIIEPPLENVATCEGCHTNEAMLKATVEDALGHHLPTQSDTAQVLLDAMRYATLSGGKRIRPLLVCATCTGLGGDLENALAPACAVEMVHAASLILDDLPCMDDASLRRGQPANRLGS